MDDIIRLTAVTTALETGQSVEEIEELLRLVFSDEPTDDVHILNCRSLRLKED